MNDFIDPPPPFRRLATAALLALACAACAKPAPVPAASPTGALHAEQAWARATPPGAPVAGGYLILRNDGAVDDRLVSLTSPDAQHVEIHEMRMAGGAMQMRMLGDGIAVPAGATVTLAPGAMHLMFIAPAHPFKAGERVRATLTYAHAPPQTLAFSVQPLGAMSGPDASKEHEADGHAMH